jgi:putative acetyltransferase
MGWKFSRRRVETLDDQALSTKRIIQANPMKVIPGDLSDPRIIDLLRAHLTTARAATGPGSAHALDLSGLQSADIDLWSIWDGEALVGVGALKRLSASAGEVKSMHTAQSARRKGAGAAMLRHIITAARASGLARLSLETGSWDYFQPARALYRGFGFVECPPFGDYKVDPNSVFMTLGLNREE